MPALNKRSFRGEARGDAASPVLVVIALALFAALVFAIIAQHPEAVIAAIVATGHHGIEPVFVGP
jgi:hypothetical protein